MATFYRRTAFVAGLFGAIGNAFWSAYSHRENMVDSADTIMTDMVHGGILGALYPITLPVYLITTDFNDLKIDDQRIDQLFKELLSSSPPDDKKS